MNPKQNERELSVQELEQLLLEKRQRRSGQTVRRVAGEEHHIAQDEKQGQEPGQERSPELWRGARGRDRYFRTAKLRPIALTGSSSDLESHRRERRKRLLLAAEVVLVVAFALIMGRAYLQMRELNQSMAKELSEPSPTVADSLTVTETRKATVESQSNQPTTTVEPTVTVAQVLPGAPPRPTEELTREPLLSLPDSRPTTMSPTATPEALLAEPEEMIDGRRLVVTQIGVDAPIVEGDTWEDLKLGIGTHEGSVAPGQPGNLVLSAHNDIYGEIFRELHKLSPGDSATIYWEQETFTYRVRQVEIVEPTRIEYIQQSVEPRLTLITCYPYLLDTHRVIVIADLIP